MNNLVTFYFGFTNPDKQWTVSPATFGDQQNFNESNQSQKIINFIATKSTATTSPHSLVNYFWNTLIGIPFRKVCPCCSSSTNKMLFQSSFMRKHKPTRRHRVVGASSSGTVVSRNGNTFYLATNSLLSSSTSCTHAFCRGCTLQFSCSVTSCPRSFERAAFPEQYECCYLNKLHCHFNCGVTFCVQCNIELDRRATNCARYAYSFVVHLEKNYTPDFCFACPPGTHPDGWNVAPSEGTLNSDPQHQDKHHQDYTQPEKVTSPIKLKSQNYLKSPSLDHNQSVAGCQCCNLSYK